MSGVLDLLDHMERRAYQDNLQGRAGRAARWAVGLGQGGRAVSLAGGMGTPESMCQCVSFGYCASATFPCNKRSCRC